MPKFWSMQGQKKISQTSYLVLSSPKQWVYHFSFSYFGKTSMASVALFWLSKYFLPLSPYLNLYESSSATLNLYMELFLAQTLAYSFKRCVSFLFLFQTCSTNWLFWIFFLTHQYNNHWMDTTILDIPGVKNFLGNEPLCYLE